MGSRTTKYTLWLGEQCLEADVTFVVLQRDGTGNLTCHSCCIKYVLSQEGLQDERHISMFVCLLTLASVALMTPLAFSFGKLRPYIFNSS